MGREAEEKHAAASGQLHQELEETKRELEETKRRLSMLTIEHQGISETVDQHAGERREAEERHADEMHEVLEKHNKEKADLVAKLKYEFNNATSMGNEIIRLRDIIEESGELKA